MFGMSVKRMLAEVDSEEIAEWHAYDQRWPLNDGWQQTARVCRVIMAASGHFKKHDLPDESAFIPAVVKPEQTDEQMLTELLKLKTPINQG
jgi:hypothetical protein